MSLANRHLQRFEWTALQAPKVRNVSRLGSYSCNFFIPLIAHTVEGTKSFDIRFESCLGFAHERGSQPQPPDLFGAAASSLDRGCAPVDPSSGEKATAMYEPLNFQSSNIANSANLCHYIGVNTTAEVEVGLRERKRRETRAALSLAAIRLCVQRGWEDVTVDDIAAAANVSPRTFRNYFSTKAEAVAAGHLERMLRIADELRARPASEALWTAITNSVAAQFEPPALKSEVPQDSNRWLERIRFILTEPSIHGEILKASAAAQVELAEVIAERVGARRVKDLYPQVAAAVVTAVVGTIVDRWLRDGPSGSIVPLLRKAFELVATGFPENKSKTSK